jgi:hypothetical protein
MNPIAIWHRELDPTPILTDPFVRPGSTLMTVADKLGAVVNYLSTLNADDEHGLGVATLAVDFAFAILAHLGLEDDDGPRPPIINLEMARLAIGNLRAVVRGHLEEWQQAAYGDYEPDSVAHPQDESKAVIAPFQDEPEAPIQQDEPEAVPAQGLVIDPAKFTIHYDGLPCFLGYTTKFHLFVRLAESPGTYVTHHDLAEDVWGDDLTSPTAIHKQASLLGQAIRDAGISSIEIDGSTVTGHYRLILR